MQQYLKASPSPFFMKEGKCSTYLWILMKQKYKEKLKER